MSINFLCFGKWNRKYLFSSFWPKREMRNQNAYPTGKLLGIYANVWSRYSSKLFVSYILNARTSPKKDFKCFYITCHIFYKCWIYSWNMSVGNCHVAALRLAPASSEVIAHGIRKHRKVQKPLLVSLHTDICLLLISTSTEYSLCSVGKFP